MGFFGLLRRERRSVGVWRTPLRAWHGAPVYHYLGWAAVAGQVAAALVVALGVPSLLYLCVYWTRVVSPSISCVWLHVFMRMCTSRHVHVYEDW